MHSSLGRTMRRFREDCSKRRMISPSKRPLRLLQPLSSQARMRRRYKRTPQGTLFQFSKYALRVLQKPAVSCYHCGGQHLASHCRYKDAVCRGCGKKGHLVRVCCSKATSKAGQVQTPTKKKSTSTHNITASESPEPVPSLNEPTANNVSSYDMFSLPGQAKPIMLPVKLQDNLIQMELDTGAALSIIGEATYQEIFRKDHQLDSTNITLQLYNGQELPCSAGHNRRPSQV